jgi:carboxyl-terminal processing protease
MKMQTRGLVILAGFIATLAVGIFFGRLTARPAVAVHPASADTYQLFDNVVDVREKILRFYVDNVDDKKLMQGAVDGMLAQLDPYSAFFTKEEWEAFDKQTHGQFSGIGAEISQDPNNGHFVIVSPIEDSPALKAGVLAGDRIVKINGETLESMNLKELITGISGTPGSEVKLTVIHEGETAPVELTVKRAVITVHSVKGWKISPTGWDFLIDPEHRIAYVRITSFMETTAEDLDKALLPLLNSDKALRGIVLDLRFNPGGLLTAGIDVANRFLDSGVIVTTRGRDGRNQFEAVAKKEGTYPRVPLVVLVNEYSASASEIVSGALYDHHRAVLIGNRTFGKGSVQNLMPLDGGKSALKLTTAHYYLPSGRNITRQKDAKTWGVEPDPPFLLPMSDADNRALLRARRDSEIIHVRPATQPTTAEGFTDKQLQRAMEVLLAYQSFSGQTPVQDVTTTRPSASASLPATLTSPAPTAPSAPTQTAPRPATSLPATEPAPAESAPATNP